MKRKYSLVFIIFLLIFCVNLIFYANNLDTIKKDLKVSTRKSSLKNKIYDNQLFIPKCDCHKYSILSKLDEQTNKYQISKIFNDSTKTELYEISKEILESSLFTCDKFHSLKRGPSQKIISYSLYGKNEKFYKNIEEIIESSSKHFPDWVIRIYYDSSIHKQTICQFECHENANKLNVVDFCNVEERNISLNGMYWRLMPLGKFLL
jgi:hypothetical protein